MPLILGTNSIKDTGYEVANSCRFDGSNDYFTKTFGSDPTSTRIGTVSYWCKRSSFGASIAGGLTTSGNGSSYMTNFNSSDQIDFWFYYPGSGADYEGELKTNAVFRDPSAWMHVFFSYDTTQVTNTNRLKLYINGTQVTSLATATYPDQNQDVYWGTQTQHRVGANPDTAASKWNGYMAEVAYVDGVAHAVTDFGEFDSDSPTIWKPKDISSGITWGTNGFYLDFEDSSALGDDVSGNNNDWTATGIAAVDQATDTPTNNFATLNPLNQGQDQTAVFTEANLEYESTQTGSSYPRGISSIGVNSGKWYMEIKNLDSEAVMIGISNGDGNNRLFADNTNDIGYHTNGNKYVNGSGSSYGDTYTTNDIIGIALDMDNHKLYFSKNGTFQDSGDPTSGATGTGAISVTDPSATGFYFFTVGDPSSAGTPNVACNFGNPSFSISSSQADDNGYGNFEYDVPSGFYALCTKNLAEFGG